jgi:hypothetical protein
VLPVTRQLTNVGWPPKTQTPPPTLPVLFAMTQFSTEAFELMQKTPPPSSLEVLATMVQLMMRGEEEVSQ